MGIIHVVSNIAMLSVAYSPRNSFSVWKGWEPQGEGRLS